MSETQSDNWKRIARRNAAVERFQLERAQSLSKQDIAERARGLRSFDDLQAAYHTMKNADFCEAIALAVKNRSFSDPQIALHLREWVRCGGSDRTSFPEWFEAEGRSHILRLNNDWLSSGVDSRTSFEDWLVTQSDVKTSNAWQWANRLYGHGDTDILTALLATAYNTVSCEKDDADILAYYASFVCGIAVTLRMGLGIDVNTMALIVEPMPLPVEHPLTKLFSILDHTTKELLNFLANAKDDDPRRVDANAMLQASLTWRGYLMALNNYPDAWEDSDLYALAVLRILIGADPESVLASLRNEAHVVRGNFGQDIRNSARAIDWPPRGFVDLYRKNKSVLEARWHALGAY